MRKPAARESRVGERVEGALLLAGAAILLFVLPHFVGGDGEHRFRALQQLIEERRLSDFKFSLVAPIFSAPLYLIGKTAYLNVVVFLAGVGAAWWLMRGRVEAGLARRFLLLLVAASMFPNHVMQYYGEVFTAVLLGVGILAVRFGRPILGWTLAVLGVVNTPSTVVALGLVTGVIVLREKRWWVFAALAAAVALILLENWIRRGDPLATGYAGDGGPQFQTALPYSGVPSFGYPLFFGLLSVLLSFGKGILWYAPGAFLPVPAAAREKLRGTYGLWLVVLAALVLVYAKWWSWHGGWFWGPRFFLFASIPASFALAARLGDTQRSLGGNALTLAALLLSSWVGMCGVAFSDRTLTEIYRSWRVMQPYSWYIPEMSELWRPFVAPVPIERHGYVFIAYGIVVALWLGGPLAAVVARQAQAALRDLVRRLAAP